MPTRSLLRSPAAMLVAATAALLLAGCASTRDEPPEAPIAAQLGHIHGLGVDPGDDDLIVASHHGVFRVPKDGDPQLVAGRAQDTMAFTIIGPSTYLASGHPEPTDTSQPTSLGLIESTDGARTWTSRSMAGEADFHVLEPTDAGTYGYDSLTGTLMLSNDQRTWGTVATGQIYDVAANPEQPTDLLVTTPAGIFAPTGGRLGAPIGDRNDVVLIERPTADLTVGVTSEAEVLTSTDRGRSWTALKGPSGKTQAFTTDQAGWHLASTTGIWTSTDRGASWERVLNLR